MPTIDGYEATRQIRTLGTDISKIHIIAMTTKAFEEDKQNALNASMNTHVSKSIFVQQQKETLSEFL